MGNIVLKALDAIRAAVAEIALIENMQRKDLTPWEEADGLAALCHRYGYTHEEVSKKVGKSRSTVTEAITLAAIPEVIRQECRRADINVKSLLLQIVRQPDEEGMIRMAEEVVTRNLTRDDARQVRRVETGVKTPASPYVYRYAAPANEYKLELRFSRSQVDKSEICAALRAAANKLEEDETDCKRSGGVKNITLRS